MRDCVRVLIKHKANVNTKDDRLHTPLIDADTLTIASMLVAAGADVNAKDNCRMTPLHWAACLDHVEVAEFLVAHGAKINAREDDGHTPIFFALNSSRLVKSLLEHKADAKETDISGWSLLHQASGGPIDTPTFTSPTEMSWPKPSAAQESESKEVVRLLVNYGANVNAIAKDWGTPLHVAAFHGCTDIARQLVACGANADTKDDDGKTPLEVAAEKGNIDVADYLRKLTIQERQDTGDYEERK